MSFHELEPDERPEFLVRRPKEFFGIEEVTVSTEEHMVIDGGEIKSNDIDDVMSTPDANVRVLMRKHITITVLSLWVVWTLVGLIAFVITGNPILLISSPAIMSVPMYKMLGYYF